MQDRPARATRRRWGRTGVVCLALAATLPPALAAPPRSLGLERQSLDLAGPPADLLSPDLNGDGRNDLVVVTAYTEWDEIGLDHFEGLLQVTTVVPALFDRREALVFLAGDDGKLAPYGEPLALPTSVLALEAGPPGLPLVALTDAGLEVLRLAPEDTGPGLERAPLITERPVLAGSETFLPDLDLVQDVDGDGTEDLLLPGSDGPVVFLGTGRGLAASPASRLRLPNDRDTLTAGRYSSAVRVYPFPRATDLSGDGIPDFLVSGKRKDRFRLVRGEGRGHFAEPVVLTVPKPDAVTVTRKKDSWTFEPEIAHLGDLDGDGRLEAVVRLMQPTGRSEFKQAKKPRFLYRFHRLREDLTLEAEPYFETEVLGYAEDVEFEGASIMDFQDLDGDGRLDLVTMTLDFSLLQVVRVLATKRVSVRIHFHVYAQQDDGSFVKVPDLELSEKLRFDLDDLTLGRFAQFAGDFDGDGVVDFVRLGRGQSVTIHRGQPGCRFPPKTDLTIELDEAIRDLAQVRVRDLDGDGRADLGIARPLPSTDPGVSGGVRLDLYLSGETP